MADIKLKEKIAGLADSPGVYIFKDSQGAIIYIGKAKSLKKRVQSYFTRNLSAKTQAMVSRIFDIEYRLANSQSQAQILEASLIKTHQPQYNISLKDDKSFPWIRISDEEFPVVSICRRKKAGDGDASTYFGPYTNAKLLREALKLIRRIFGFRSCKKMPRQACLFYRVKLCPAPCIKKISPGQYRQAIGRINMFLDSRHAQLLEGLFKDMMRSCAKKDFEGAAKIRDQISALSAISEGSASRVGLDELQDLRNLLGLDKLPLRIEAFDISNISGKEATGAMVSFYGGEPDKNNYRRFRIKTVSAIDDYAMLKEVVARRYARLARENRALPDLVLIDGGRGHLLAAAEEIKELGIRLSLVSIAKEEENIYIADRALPIKLKEGSGALNLLRRIRDEAHRFALKYHHLLHSKKVIGR
jgi:excinuclease ABC subunit C